MTLKEKLLFHQIHPAKLATDVAAAVVSLYFLWQHELALGLLIHFVPPPLASAAIMRFARLERYKNAPVGAYLLRYMTAWAQAARLLGDLILVLGAWFHSPLALGAGIVIVLSAPSYGLLVSAVRSIPRSDAEGEEASPTQPFSALPPLVPQRLSAADPWGPTPADREACRAKIAGLRSQGVFTPPSVQGTVAIPGNVGGMNWSSGAFDPERQLFVANVNNLPMEVHLIPRGQYDAGNRENQLGALRAEISPQHGTPHGMSRQVLRSPSGLPCNPPPWGSLVAVDLAAGSIRWSVPLGTSEDLAPNAPVIRGTPNLGGAIVTAGGVIFVAAAMDDYLRAFDVETGAELWKGRLPAGGQATPMTYRLRPDGKHFVVIAAGGHGKLGTKLGDALVAFALP
jgi:glucose dehydrogenase